MINIVFDEFDMFMLGHSLEFREVVNGYLDAKTTEGEDPPDDVVIDRAKTMKSFIDHMLKERGLESNAT